MNSQNQDLSTLSTSNISNEALLAFLKEHYMHPSEDSKLLTANVTFFGAIDVNVFSFNVESGIISNLTEVSIASITLEQICNPDSGIRNVFHSWLSDEMSKKYAQTWLTTFVQTTDINSLTPEQLAALVPICICTDDGTITDIGYNNRTSLIASDIALYRFILHAIKEGVYPWDHIS